MVWISNIVFYNLFRFEKKTQCFFNNIFFFFMRNKKIRDSFNKRGVKNPEKIIIQTLEDPEIGVSSVISSAHLVFLYFLFIFGCVNFLLGFLKAEPLLNLFSFFMMGLFAYGFAYWFSFRENKFLDYFEKFNRLSKIKKTKYAWLTLFIVLLLWFFCVGSVVFRIYRFH